MGPPYRKTATYVKMLSIDNKNMNNFKKTPQPVGKVKKTSATEQYMKMFAGLSRPISCILVSSEEEKGNVESE